MPATSDRPVDVYRGFKFRIVIGGVNRAGFKEVAGLDIANDVVDYRNGDEPTHSRKLAGLVKFANITLKRGASDDQDLQKWRSLVLDGKMSDARKDGQIIYVDDEGKDAAEWDFVAAWPFKWTLSSFNASSNEVLIETLELAHEGLKRVK
ncbi:phage tail protein [Ideonella sp. YS5]|uniref:phage tail protein n=1 Tax=Ideonella sp. YS5 TaxID=3453714 RepID=UPI003EE96270